MNPPGGPAEASLTAAEMAFKLAHAKHDPHTQRAYVELREDDEDGGEIIAVTIFSYRTTENLTKRRIEQEIVRKARHILRKAGLGADGK
jgi:hypothetical protein